MIKIPFEDGQKTQEAYATINGQNYLVTPAVWQGKTPLSALNLNKMQSNIENTVEGYTYNLILTANVNAGGEITLPFYYKVGNGSLIVFYEGLFLKFASDGTKDSGSYTEVGEAGTISNKIKITNDWSAETGDCFEFIVKGVYEDDTV